ncbi:MAG: hypothetical protein RLZZ546_1167, partial [Bacteroidota bacterium]
MIINTLNFKKSIHVFIFILFVNWVYLDYISIKWAYFGASSKFSFEGFLVSLLTSFLAGTPLLKLKKQTTGGFIVLLLYYYTYIPMAVVLSYKCFEKGYDFAQYLVAICLSFFLFATIGSKNFPLRFRSLEAEIFKKINGLILFNTLIISVILVSLGKDLNFVNPFGEDVYTQRFSARDSVSRTIILDYLIMLSSGVITPLIFSYGLYSKRIGLVILSVAQTFILYSIAANKGYIFSLFLILMVAKLSQKDNYDRYFLKFNSLLSLTIVLVGLIFSESILYEAFMAIFGVRFLMISGINSVNYIEYFITHQKTYYTHLNIVNYFSNTYPYGDLQIGQVIGDYYYNLADANFNANFFLTDGVAAAGIFGVVFIGILGGLLMALINILVSK